MSKQEDEFERATKLQQNLLDMELTKEQDEYFKALVERQNTNIEENPCMFILFNPKYFIDGEPNPIIGFEDKKVITQSNENIQEEEDPVFLRVNKQLKYLENVLQLTPGEHKSWFYKLRREEKELEKQREIQRRIDAKKQVKRMMKKLKLPLLQKLGKL